MSGMRWMLVAALGLVLAACASIGRPEGGPRDKEPPVFVRSNPEPGSREVSRTRLQLFFDENIKLEDPSNKIIISPAQKQAPQIMGNGHRVQIELRDTLLPNTTYTIDLADAVTDLNEGNILDGCAIDFSTGTELDTLRISGMVFEARNLEPAQGMVVGVYRDSLWADTTLLRVPLERVAKTDQYGRFTIRNLKEGTYRVVAIDDRNRDWHWDRSENIALHPVAVSPTAERVTVTDTLVAVNREDSLVQRQATHYLPDDLLMTWFNEDYHPQYLRDYERTDRRRVTLKMGARSDSLPQLRMVNGPLAGSDLAQLTVLETRQGLDSLVYWLRDTLLVNQDSLLVEARYLKTDTLEQLVPQTDTLRLFMKNLNKLRKDQEKALKERNEKIEKIWGDKHLSDSAKQASVDSIYALERVWTQLKMVTGAQQELNKPLRLEADVPIALIDTARWKLEMEKDSTWLALPLRLEQDTAMIRQYTIDVKWTDGAKYRLTADTAAMVNVYGQPSKALSHNFTVKNLEDYGNLYFSFSDKPADMQMVVELLDGSDKVVDTCRVAPGKSQAAFHFLNPGAYYARAIHDANLNADWDTGCVADTLQAEDVYYYPKKINVRKNWDIEQEWGLYTLAVDQQKPNEVKKNRPKKRKTFDDERDKRRNGQGQYGDEDDEEYNEEEDGWDQGNQWGVGSQYNNARRGSGRNTSPLGNRRGGAAGGGFQRAR